MVFDNLPNEIKGKIISYLNNKCFRYNKILFFLKNDKYYNFTHHF